MSILKQSTLLRNLDKYRVLINDIDPTSRYFRVRNIPDVLVAGRNSFLIHGSPKLVNTTEVYIELTDVDGNVIFSKPIKNYQEGLARVVSIDIYQDTPPGPGKLVILGEVTEYIDGTPIPPEWISKYNVKWSKSLTIAPSVPNDDIIRFYNTPRLTVTEVLSPYQRVTGALIEQTFTGSNVVQTTQPIVSPSPQFNMILRSSGSLFSRDMETGEFRSLIGTQIFSSSIKKVINDTTIMLTDFYKENGEVIPFSVDTCSITYQEQSQLYPSELTRSYAKIELQNLQTFSGQAYQYEVKVKNVDGPSNYESLGTIAIDPMQLLETQSIHSTDHKLNYGNFTKQAIADFYWTAGDMTTY